MNKNYKISKKIGPDTFEPFLVISYKEKPIVRINVAMAKEDSEYHPFSKFENFENDWEELTDFLKDFVKNEIKNNNG